MILGQHMSLEHARPEACHPILALMLERVAAGSRRGSRVDGAVIGLAIEGGGLGGSVSAGMCVLLEQLGLVDAVDVAYGTSAGALNAAFTSARQAALACTDYLDVASYRFSNPLRILRGRPIIDFDFLFTDVIANRKPFSATGLAVGPALRVLAVDLATRRLRVLKDFADVEEMAAAVRVSCSLPLLSGPPLSFHGVPMADGGMLESIPYATAAREATHVLVLRSRTVSYRKAEYPRAMIAFARRAAHPAIAPLLAARPGIYNAEAEHLDAIGRGDDTLVQLAPAEGTPKVKQLEHSREAIRIGLAAGANAVAAALGMPEVGLHWQPAVYAVSPRGASRTPIVRERDAAERA